jgi:glycosyltransferase involved in cell wall biosynthesis
MTEPEVSIIIPVCNGEKYLKECLDSVAAQTMNNYELICINDGSTDGTRKILEEYQRRDKRVRIINQTNMGYGLTMNRGIDEAKGKYIGVVEADDCVDRDMFRTLSETAELTRAEVVKADYYEFTGAGRERKLTYMQVAPDKRLYGRVLDSTATTALFYAVQMTWEGIYLRSFLKKNGIYHNCSPGASFQDNGFWFQVFARAKRVCFVNKPLYMYRIDNMAASTKCSDISKIVRMFAEYDFILDFLKKNPRDMGRLYTTYLHFRLDNILSRFFCASAECRKEIALMIRGELREAAKRPDFSWELFGGALRKYLEAILTDAEAFADNPPRSINDICWSEVAGRRYSASIDPNAAIPPKVIMEYLDDIGKPGDAQSCGKRPQEPQRSKPSLARETERLERNETFA